MCAASFPPPVVAILPTERPPSSSFWETRNVRARLKELQDTLKFAKTMQKELEILSELKDVNGSLISNTKRSDTSFLNISKIITDRCMSLVTQESSSLGVASSVIIKLRSQLEPFRFVEDETTPWEEKSAAQRLRDRVCKSKRNKMWRKRKRRRLSEMHVKDHEEFDQADKEADEWRAREIARDIAKRKVEKMKEIVKLKEKEEKKKLQAELETVLIVEKLQELRSIRVQKLKKQGHFFPDEDDKFLERVRAAVEEEQQQAKNAEESKAMLEHKQHPDFQNTDRINQNEVATDGNNQKREDNGRNYDSVTNLPLEFYHYYYGSKTDMGTLIEVRRMWDAYVRPGGSRIPGHWVHPSPPSNPVWASYLVQHK